jgi:hypothetical protein
VETKPSYAADGVLRIDHEIGHLPGVSLIFFWASNKHSAAPGLSLHGGLTTTLDLAHPGHRTDCMSSFSQKEAEISILSDVNEIGTHRPTLTSMPSRLKLQSSTRIGPLSLGRNRYQCRSSERSGNCGPGTAPYRFQAVRPTRRYRGRCGIPCLAVRWVGNRSSDRSEWRIPALKRWSCVRYRQRLGCSHSSSAGFLEFVRHACEIGRRRCLHFSHDLTAVNLHCDFSDAHRGSNLFVEMALRDVVHNLSLAVA